MKNKSILMGLFVAAAGVVFYVGADSACNKEAVIKAGSAMALGGVIFESREDHLVLVCDAEVKKGFISFVIKKDGVRVGGVAKESDISFISFKGD